MFKPGVFVQICYNVKVYIVVDHVKQLQLT